MCQDVEKNIVEIIKTNKQANKTTLLVIKTAT